MSSKEKDDLTPAELARLEDEGGIVVDDETQAAPARTFTAPPCTSEGVNKMLGSLNPEYN